MKNFKQRGLSLIELLVSLAIGGFLIVGAVTMQSQTRRTFTVNEQQARLQETARYTLSVIEPEVQLAGLMGYSNHGDGAIYENGTTQVPAANTKKGKSAQAGVPAVLDSCGPNYVLDVATAIYSDNGTWSMSCAAQGGGFKTTTDTLLIRHASVDKVAPEAGRIQIYANRMTGGANQRLFTSGVAPGPLLDNFTEIRNLVMEMFYISKDSDGRPGMPALRVKQISATAGAGSWDDQEVIRGVEDIQIEIGVDPGADNNGDGVPDDPGGDGYADFVNGDVGRYVAPGDAIITSGQTVAVRIWVRVRAEEPESGYINRRQYKYGSTNFTPNDSYRRVVMSRTIFMRNSRAFQTS